MKLLSHPLFLAIVAGTAFGIWPNIASKSKISPQMLTATVGIALFLTGIFSMYWSNELTSGLSVPVGFQYVIAGCAINALGYICFSPVVMLTQKIGTTTYLITVIVAMVISTYLYGVLVLKETVNYVKVLGIVTIIIGIILVKKD